MLFFAYSDHIFALVTPEEHMSQNLFVKRELEKSFIIFKLPYFEVMIKKM